MKDEDKYPFLKINECTNKNKCNGKHNETPFNGYVVCSWHCVVCKYKKNVQK